MDSARICAVALIAVAAAAMIKQIASGFSPSLRAAAFILIASLLLLAARPAVDYLNGLFELTGFSRYATVIMKSFGIALLCHGCATVCRDLGESTVAGCVEAAGKLEIFLLCIPLMNDLLSVIRRLLMLA